MRDRANASARRLVYLGDVTATELGSDDAPEAFHFQRPAWQAKAACKGKTDIFFSARGDFAAVAEAKAICAGCAVNADCLAWALDNNERAGIWAGQSEKKLRRIRLQRNKQGDAA